VAGARFAKEPLMAKVKLEVDDIEATIPEAKLSG
jgi:hypothetical protein